MEFIKTGEFMQHLFDRESRADQAAKVVAGILDARSPRLSVGIWRYGIPEPLWVMSNLAPQDALRIYHARMKNDESFKDLQTCSGWTNR